MTDLNKYFSEKYEDLLEFINKDSKTLILMKPVPQTELLDLGRDRCRTIDEIDDLEPNSRDTIITIVSQDELREEILSKLIKSTKPGGVLASKIISGGFENVEKVELELKTSGYVNIKIDQSKHFISAQKPNYEIGSSRKLNLAKKPAAAVWKLDDDDDDEETIDPDNLIDEDDLKKPDPSSLRVCGTTGKRKACKDCSCGLAEELAVEAQNGKVVDTKNAPKSSCGSCYLGDAFRCASCPYLGMPAFKPGEKIQLSDNQLKADI